MNIGQFDGTKKSTYISNERIIEYRQKNLNDRNYTNQFSIF